MEPDPFQEVFQFFINMPLAEILYTIAQIVFWGGGTWMIISLYFHFKSLKNKDIGELLEVLPDLTILPKTSKYHTDGGLEYFTISEVPIEDGELTAVELEALEEIDGSENFDFGEE